MLLKTAGVETVRELARRNPEHVYEKLMQVNEQEHVVDLLPSLEHWNRSQMGLGRPKARQSRTFRTSEPCNKTPQSVAGIYRYR
jgi:hypothetical protein